MSLILYAFDINMMAILHIVSLNGHRFLQNRVCIGCNIYTGQLVSSIPRFNGSMAMQH